MNRAKSERRKAQRKTKILEKRKSLLRSSQMEKARFLFYEAMRHDENGNPEKALLQLEKAVRYDPGNEDYLFELGRLGNSLGRRDIELSALQGLRQAGALQPQAAFALCCLLTDEHRYLDAAKLIDETLQTLPRVRVRNKKSILNGLRERKLYCEAMIEKGKNERKPSPKSKQPDAEPVPPGSGRGEEPAESQDARQSPVPEIQVHVDIDTLPLEQALSEGKSRSVDEYELSLAAYRIRFSQTFENLICLGLLQGVRSFWFQEETVRKAMKGFRGRALLADEVGLGKTIEALMILKEYVLRGMVKSALILVPTPLVTQWNEELTTKFELHFLSTENADFRSGEAAFWDRPYVLASINVAKSSRNFDLVTRREWDLVIVDEAHHLKNRSTLNWKLVNSLKKRFLLLLTATPVENNLMELHNLATLVQPGRLKTAAEFKREFMTSGDPTDPRNREALKDLLGEIMIRNTRALAKIDVPPRFAQTVKVRGLDPERALYEKISDLVRAINETEGKGRRLLLKNLLEEAGSSPRAVGLTLSRLLERESGLAKYEREIRETRDMCFSLEDNSKHRMLLKLVNASQEKMIVFVKYLGTIEHIAEFLDRQHAAYALFHGRMDSREKEEQINRFRDGAGILIASEIGGEGRNLQFCSKMINYDLPWNPMRIEQRIGRIHRIGQQKEVMIYNLCAEASIEERILDILDRKINMFEMVIGEIDMVLGRITGDQEFSDMVYDIWVNSPGADNLDKGFNQLGTRLKRAKTGYESTKALDEKLFGENYEL